MQALSGGKWEDLDRSPPARCRGLKYHSSKEDEALCPLCLNLGWTETARGDCGLGGKSDHFRSRTLLMDTAKRSPTPVSIWPPTPASPGILLVVHYRATKSEALQHVQFKLL